MSLPARSPAGPERLQRGPSVDLLCGGDRQGGQVHQGGGGGPGGVHTGEAERTLCGERLMH